MRRATELGGRRRHDQQRLLVELELDDSLYQGALRAGIGQNVPLHTGGVSGRRTTYATDTSDSHAFEPSYDQDFTDPRPRLQSRTPRDSVAKPLTERQLQQLHARRLSSPYKLKQQVQGSRNDPTRHRHRQPQSPPRRSTSRPPSVRQSPAQLVIEAIRQNIHLRDQVLAHLQQELMGVLPLHRASHAEKSVPQRVVKLLNRLRSLSLSVVEAVVYLSSEIGEADTRVEREILEQEFYGYLLQMASSDTDFLACSPALQRFFEDFEVDLTRNPFVDGLSLDSSEVLLCSCHQTASSDRLFCSASSSASSLLRLLTHKLEAFALQTQRYLQGWQTLPAERVAAALLHLTDLETRFDALRTLPRYLQSHGDSRRFVPQQLGRQQRGSNDVACGYGTFEDETMQRMDRLDASLSGGDDRSPSQMPVMQAWVGSPVSKAPREERPPSLRTAAPAESLPPESSSASARRLSPKEEDSRSASPLSCSRIPAPACAGTGASDPRCGGDQPSHSTSVTPSSSRSTTNEAGSGGNEELPPLVLPLPMLDTAAIAKSSSRSSQSERSTSKKRSRTATDASGERRSYADVGIQLSEPSTPTSTTSQPRKPARNHSARSMRDEAIQVSEEESSSVELEQNLFTPVVTRRDLLTDAPPTPEREILSSLRLPHQLTANPSDAMNANEAESGSAPTSLEAIDGEAKQSVKVAGAPAHVALCEAGDNADVERDNDGAYECDFEYSSNEALSSIAMALRMLPSFSFSNVEAADEALKREEAIPPNDSESGELTRAEELQGDLAEVAPVPTVVATTSRFSASPASTRPSTQREVATHLEDAIHELERVEQTAELPVPEDDEYAYSSSTAVSSIAMALSLLPHVCLENALSGTGEQSEPWAFEDFDSFRTNTYRSLEDDQVEGRRSSSRSEAQVDESVALTAPDTPRSDVSWRTNDEAAYSSAHSYGPVRTSANTVNSSPVSSRRSSDAVTTRDHARVSCPASSRLDTSARAGDRATRASTASSRSNNSASTSYQGDDECEPDEFSRIFALCRDIQGTAFDMSHWVSQREVEDHMQSVAQPFSALMGYSSPTATTRADDVPKYLERELKMLRRNFTHWKTACAEQKRAKLVVRRLVARRKVRRFLLHHHNRCVQVRADEENRLRGLAASRIQRNWRVYRHSQQVAQRKTAFRAVHMAFRRTVFFVGIARRRRRREWAKEKVVRWWRRQRLRVKKKTQRQEQRARERARRSRALRDIQRFLKEVLLRRKLKAAQEMAKSILFKEQLKWTKAKRDVERSMKLNSKHRRELIADMNARLADIDRRWKASEQERLQLLTHHERLVQQQQQAGSVRRRRLAALKIQTFFRVCLLHKKLQQVESEKKQCELKLRDELSAKETRAAKVQRRMGQTRTHVRVLERKLGRMAQQAVAADSLHRRTVQDHHAREKASRERAARQRIKAFVDAKVLARRAASERRKLQLQQALLLAEKREVELMSSEEQLEQRRTALLTAAALRQRLCELEERSEALLVAKNRLAAEKRQEALEAAAALERARVEAGMQQVASWVTGKMQLAKLNKEKAAIRASAAQAMEDEKRRRRNEIEAKRREVTAVKTSSYMQQRLSQHRNQKAVETIRSQQQEKTAQEKAAAERTRAQLVQMILDVKLLTERESEKGIVQGLGGVARFHKALQSRRTRLQDLRRRTCARSIQRAWRRWMRQQRLKRGQELALARLEEAKQRQALARRLQAWWRRWAVDQQRRREQQRAFDAHLEEIQARASVRKIQGGWRRWVSRRREQQLAFNVHVDAICARANVRKIQAAWRRRLERENARRREQQRVFGARLDAIRARANVRNIQRVWRRWVQCENARRCQQLAVFEAHLQAVRTRASVRKIQSAWWRWVKSENERRRQQHLALERHLGTIRQRANARKIQGGWRRGTQRERERRQRQQRAFEAHLEAIRGRANARRIQGVWRRWVSSKLAQREARRVQQLVFACALRIQRWLRKRQKARRDQAEKLGALRTAKAQVIQRQWKSWRQWKQAEQRKERLRVQREACARKLQRTWRRWREWKRRRDESAKRIQERWEKRQTDKKEAERVRKVQLLAATRIRKQWLQWRCKRQYEQDKARRRRRQQLSSARIHSACCKWWERKQQERQAIRAVGCIQKAWRSWSLERAERRRQEEEERAVALRIQQNWTKKLRVQRRKEEAERLGERQRVSAVRLQRAWRKWRLARGEIERQAQVKQEHERRAAAALVLQSQWRHSRRLEAEGRQLQLHACATKIQQLWQARKLGTEERTKLEAERSQHASALKVQLFWRKHHRKPVQQCESEQHAHTQHAGSAKRQRNSGAQQHRRKMENARVQHEQHMSALKIQTAWLKWHHEQQEEREKERIRHEQYESSLKIQRSWGIAQRRRRVNQERLRHQHNMSALKIQKQWRRWRHLRLEQRNRLGSTARRGSTAPPHDEASSKLEQLRDERERQQRLDRLRQRSYGRCILRVMRRFHRSRTEEKAATKIEALWKGKLYRTHYLHALDRRRAEEARQYRLVVSVLATKVQTCWRRWHTGVRQVKRSIVKDDELRLIQEAKALERKVLVAKRAVAAKRIQRALSSRKQLIATQGVSHREVMDEKGQEPEHNVKCDESVEPASDLVEPIREDVTRGTVDRTVDDWRHRELPHILTRSVNHVLFCHEAAAVIQKLVRGYQRRQRMHFSPQRSLGAASPPDSATQSFHFYFRRASAWLDWDRPTDTSSAGVKALRLRFDAQMTRRLLQLFEPSEEYPVSEIQQVLGEIVADALPVLQSSACQEDNENPRPALRYHDVDETELPRSVQLLRHLSQRRAQVRRQQLLGVDTNIETAPLPPVATSVPSSPSQRANKQVTIFTAVESASVDDATFLQQRGADLAVLEPKTQRNALHVLSFSKESYRSRAEMLAFLLGCGARLDVNAADCNGDTPLMLYASLGHLDFMQTLLQHGADVQKTNGRGQNVLHRACEEDQVEVCGFLQQLMLKDSSAENLVPIEAIAALAPPALTLHTADAVGRYPLHYLAEKGFVECAKQLVVPTEANYEWNRTLQAQGDAEGRTALHLAVLTHDAAMTAFLLTPGGGANANAFDELHRSPLHYAVESPAALPIVSRLVQHGADVNAADERGDTPLHWTAFSGRAAVAQSLLALGADPTLANSDWETPAQIAAAYGQLDCMRLLLHAQRRHGAEGKEQQGLTRPASEKTALQRLEEAVNHLHEKQAAAQSSHTADQDADGELEATAGAEQSHGGYWEELHQDVQLVEESGQFSSEGEEDSLFADDDGF